MFASPPPPSSADRGLPGDNICRPNFLVVAASARFIVQAIVASGYTASAVDGFADLETQRNAKKCLRARLSRYGSLTDDVYGHCRTLMRQDDYTALALGPGTESCHQALAPLAAETRLAGNSLETMRVCAQRSRFGMEREALADLTIPAPMDNGLWVRHADNSSGGACAELGDGRLDGDDCRGSRQTPYLPARAVSQLFIAAHGQAKTLGFSVQWQSQHDPRRPFCFGGAVNCGDVDAAARRRAERCADYFARALSLRGLNNIDYLWDGQRLYFLELNPRLSGSMQLYEDVVEHGLFAAHWRACQSSAPFVDELRTDEPATVRAYAPIYAQGDCVIPAGFDAWPDGTTDRPDTRLAPLSLMAGQPLCTVTAHGDSSADALTLLQQRTRQTLAALGQPQ